MNNLILTEEELMPEWPQVGFGDPHSDLPFNLLSVADSSEDGLRPLPESLDHYDASFVGFSPSVVPYQYNSTTWLSGEPLSLPSPVEDDFDLDAFCWPEYDPSSLGGGDFVPAGAVAWDEEIGTKTALEEETKKKNGGRRDGKSAMATATATASRTSDLGFDQIKNYFHMPITKAAKEMNVGLTVLKKRCRELRIARWPHRKMKSLNSLIHNVQELWKGMSEEEGIRRELERLEEHRRQMEENPEMQLTETTKKLRQACFKANYKRRRLSMMQQAQQQQR